MRVTSDQETKLCTANNVLKPNFFFFITTKCVKCVIMQMQWKKGLIGNSLRANIIFTTYCLLINLTEMQQERLDS